MRGSRCLLEVDAVLCGSNESVGDKVVFHTRVDLHDISTLPTHIQVEDLVAILLELV